MQGSVEQIIMRQRVNLVPQQALAEKLKKITVPLICVLIAVGGVSIFINGQMIERKISRIEQKIEALNKRQQALIAQQTAIGQLSLSVKKMEGEIIQRRKTISNLSELPSQKKSFLLFWLVLPKYFLRLRVVRRLASKMIRVSSWGRLSGIMIYPGLSNSWKPCPSCILYLCRY